MRNRSFELQEKQSINQMHNNPIGLKSSQIPTDFSKIKVGVKTLNDAIIDIDSMTRKSINSRAGDKNYVLRAIATGDLDAMREISDFWYKTSGIYSRLCRYMSFMYRYDWMVTPYVNDPKVKSEKVLEGFNKSLRLLDNFGVKKYLGEVALKVLRQGAYYGYMVESANGITVQELPPKYCRSRFNFGNKPAIEFNMRFFDECFRDTTQKLRVLNLFPQEFRKGYVLYKENKLQPDFSGDTGGWFLLDPTKTVKFNCQGEDYPAFISVIPLLIDLDMTQALDRKRMEQKLYKLIVQKMPIDKNGDLVFDVDEAQQLHTNAVQMLNGVIGAEVLTTFADIDVEDMADTGNSNQTDDLLRVERTVYNEAGVSQNQFNTDGNLALEKSIANDEAAMYNLLLQFEAFLNELLIPFNANPKKLEYRLQLLTTTIYNYKDLSKLYKEQMQLGYSKMLAQIALGQSQSSILANAYFENDILDLINVFIPPLMSSTMNADALKQEKSISKTSQKDPSASANGDGQAGRKEKPDEEKSTKTIQNKESMS